MDIGRYTVLGPLGRGGMGRVFKVRHRELGRVMALKLLEPPEVLVGLMGAEAIRSAFRREARLLAACDHPNIAPVWDLGEDRGRPFMVLDYLCMNVGTLVGEGMVVESPTRPLPAGTALNFARQTLDALEYLHGRGIIHLDVKPANLLLAADGTIKLIDLGLSRLRGEPWAPPKGLKIGSPFYAAPEQEANPQTADERSDLFSVGVVLHRLLTGLLPEGGPALDAGLPDPWREFFFRALAPEPDRRFQDAAVMRAALLDLEAELRRRGEDGCGLDEPVCTVMGRLRSDPVRTGVRGRPFDFLDGLYRPRAYHESELEEIGDGWLDRCTGLVWGPVSPWPMTWDEGAAFVAREAVAEEGWRLPTVEEAVSLLRPGQELGEFCHRPFGDRYLWLWTADRRSFTSAWFVDVGAAAVLAQDRTCRFHVRPVRSVETDGGRGGAQLMRPRSGSFRAGAAETSSRAS
jgi:serine/threonine-protein kinase